jgi:hypothetical protein
MSRLRFNPVRAKGALGALLLTLAAGASACDDDGKTAPATCLDPALPLYDIQGAGAPSVDNPCVTPVGHAISFIGEPTTSTGGTSSGSSGGKTAGGKSSVADAGAGGADAGAGGA